MRPNLNSYYLSSINIFQITDEQDLGKTKKLPSSNALFRKWYYEARGKPPDPYTIPNWAAFDVLEAALYRASLSPQNVVKGHLLAQAVLRQLSGMDIRTPYGRVAFDGNNVNNGLRSMFSQVLPSSNTSEIVNPSDLQTASFVYPMPTWEERVYEWKLLGSAEKKVAFYVTIACSVLIAAIVITVTIKRHGKYAL